MSLRVLHVYRTGFPDTQGGTEEVLRTLTRGLVERGAEVTLLFPSKRVRKVTEHMDQGVRIVRTPESFELASCNVFLRGLGAFRAAVAAADVVNYHFPWPWADVLEVIVEPRAAARHVVTYHSDIVRQKWLGRAYRPLMNAFLSRADRIVATSDIYATSSEVLRSHAGKLSVIPIGIDTRAIPPVDAARQAAWRSRTGENFFLFVGVLRYYKALQVLIDAVAGTELRVVIAGDGPEGSRLRALAQQLGAHNVLFAGRIPDEDKWTLLSLARGFVLPSDQRSEAYGVALLEAMAAGLPLVTAEIGTGVNFVNRTDVTGLTVPRDDATALREALRRLAADAELCRRLGAAGKLRTGAELGAQRMVDGYLRLYNRLLGD